MYTYQIKTIAIHFSKILPADSHIIIVPPTPYAYVTPKSYVVLLEIRSQNSLCVLSSATRATDRIILDVEWY